MNIIELQFKDGTKESFPCEKIEIGDNLISIILGGRETIINKNELKYYSIEKIKNDKE